jgi:hypothetical protein
VNCVNCNGENVATTNLNLIHFFNIQNCKNWVQKQTLYVIFVKRCVRCSAIEGISHRYHRCGPVCMWRSRVNIEEVAYKWHLGYLGAIGLLKPTRGHLTSRLGTSSLLSLHVDVWRLIFWSWVSHMMEWEGALHLVTLCCMCFHSWRMALTWLCFVMLQASYACVLLVKDHITLMSVRVVIRNT